MTPLETRLRIALSEAGVACNASMAEIRQTLHQITTSPQWAREELEEHLEQASKIVDSWPAWKKRAAEDALRNSPTCKTPRPPVLQDDCPY